MQEDETDRDSPRDYSALLLLVDIANIRPREEGLMRAILARVGIRNPKLHDENFTSLKFIDECLFDLASKAPGAVIVQFADYSLKNHLSVDDQRELLRRQKLDYAHPEKIFEVSTAKADLPLLHGRFRVGGSIISQDKFRDDAYVELVTEGSKTFDYQVNENKGEFSFVLRGDKTVHIEDWWREQNGFVTGEWLSSDEYAELDVLLRHRVKEATFEWHQERLTFNPTIALDDEGSIVVPQREPRIRRILPGSRKKRTRSRQDENIPSPARQIEPADLEGAEDLEFEFPAPPRPLPVAYLLADEHHRLRTHVGEYVTVVGRLVTVGPEKGLEWAGSGRLLLLKGASGVDESPARAIVEVCGRVEASGEQVLLRLDDDEIPTPRAFADVKNELVTRRPAVSGSSGADRDWNFSSFEGPLAVLRRFSRPLEPSSDHHESSKQMRQEEEDPRPLALGAEKPAEVGQRHEPPVNRVRPIGDPRISPGVNSRPGQAVGQVEGREADNDVPGLESEHQPGEPATGHRPRKRTSVVVIVAIVVAAIVVLYLGSRTADDADSVRQAPVVAAAQFRIAEASFGYLP